MMFVLLLCMGCQNKNVMPDKPLPVESVVWFSPEWENQDLPTNRIELLRFHHTVECQDCKMVGEMILFLLQNEFTSETKSGTIIYKSINSELLENKPILQHFEVYEEDFVINRVLDGQETIYHDPKPLELAKEADKLHQYLKELMISELTKLRSP